MLLSRSDGKKAYVSSGSELGGVVAVIDANSDKILQRIKVGKEKNASALGLETKPF